jgi:lipoprotein-releasing system permease protein
MKFETFIARRYLISRHKMNFISIISLISIAGITIGVAALIVVLSVFNGFGSLVTDLLMSFDPHLRVEIISPDGNEKDILDKLNNFKEVKSITPFVSGKVLAYRKEQTEVISIKGITEQSGDDVYNIGSAVQLGEYDLSEEGIPKVLIGLILADKMQVITGDTILLISPAGIENVITQFSMPKTERYIVSGIYLSNNNEYDASLIFTGIKSAQSLLGFNNRIQGYEIRLNDIDDSFDIKDKLERDLDPQLYAVTTWYDFHRDLFSVMQIERWAAYIILSLIIAVATFNILGSLSMSVIEKRRDIGVLRSFGTEEKSILKIFMFEGLFIGLIGTTAGVILGYLVYYIQIKYNIYPLDPTQYKINSLPMEVRLSDFFYVTGASMLLSFLASLYPAKHAAKVNPIEAIKWE